MGWKSYFPLLAAVCFFFMLLSYAFLLVHDRSGSSTNSHNNKQPTASKLPACVAAPVNNKSDEYVIQQLSKTFHKSGRHFISPVDTLNATRAYSSATMDNKQYQGGGFPTDKSTRHLYLQHYAKLFAPYSGLDITLLEIGVKMGGSVALWREFFSERSMIYGIDISPTVPTFTLEPNIKVLLLDSRNPALVDKAFSYHKFDIIVP
ncbi:hypothetical protein Pelo_16690 [Pelomyxa schiedti]|nr:hypothetical protein Pelo_16690 [Pelomyxa schiedti]